MELKLGDEVFSTDLIGTIVEIQEYSNAAKVEFNIGGKSRQLLIPIDRLIKVPIQDAKKLIEKYNKGQL